MEERAGMKELDGLLKELLKINFQPEEVENRIDAEDDSEDGILQRILLSHQILGQKQKKDGAQSCAG